ncbi:peptidoglycan-recognition protein SB1-like [Toxorhynchites rutilus septentrionalis]|uniref:peptidoglycan-recognition protein SB1-like n=1 Tax=Toxorhynchites rutilus septentrionalis TaxID=329112 RepID=UPI00247B2CFA|nr:peptidoglycan-recognition protein SB1-like [Toxorhynchites rutilus septentrionalis]
MYCSARTAAISSSSRCKSPYSSSCSRLSDYDLEAGERTPLLFKKVAKVQPAYDKQENQLQPFPATALLGILTLLLLLLIGVIIAIYLLLLQVPHPWPVSHPFYLVERHAWWSHPAALEALPLNKSAVHNVIVVDTDSETCLNHAECTQFARNVQQNTWTENGTHIPYNFLIGGDGKTYEGRGWRVQHGFADLPGKNDTVVVGVIGTYDENRPSEIMYAEIKALITESIRRLYLSPAYRLYGIMDESDPTNEPPALYSELRNWRHWTGFITK